MDGPTQDGTIHITIRSLDQSCHTYYKIFGELSATVTPVIVLHGGPGAGHDYLLPFAALWTRYGLPVIFYDQIGCGRSTHLPSKDGDRTFWTADLFIAELNNLIDHFKLRGGPGYHILGQSWGGMLAADFAGRHPKGLRPLILSSAIASQDLNLQGVKLIRQGLPTASQHILDQADETGDRESPAYKAITDQLFRTHICRTEQVPPELLPSFKNVQEAMYVYRTMYGPSWLYLDGSLLGWTSIPGLKNISVPTLVYRGEHDSSHEVATLPFFEQIPRVRLVTIPDSGHFCHLEGAERLGKVLDLVGNFLVSGSRHRSTD